MQSEPRPLDGLDMEIAHLASEVDYWQRAFEAAARWQYDIETIRLKGDAWKAAESRMDPDAAADYRTIRAALALGEARKARRAGVLAAMGPQAQEK
jgi:hypothetical protein